MSKGIWWRRKKLTNNVTKYLIYIIFTEDYQLCIFSNIINPFSIMTGMDEVNFGTLVYKVIIAYLLYQFIVSIRQNIRRK